MLSYICTHPGPSGNQDQQSYQPVMVQLLLLCEWCSMTGIILHISSTAESSITENNSTLTFVNRLGDETLKEGWQVRVGDLRLKEREMTMESRQDRMRAMRRSIAIAPTLFMLTARSLRFFLSFLPSGPTPGVIGGGRFSTCIYEGYAFSGEP